MKILVIGGTSGLGKEICNFFNSTAIGRSNGYSFPDNQNKIEELSLSYDIIVNCIPDENQLNCLESLYNLHEKHNLSTYFITIGSMSYKINNEDHFKNRLLKFSDYLLTRKNKIKHTIINTAELFNSKNSVFFTKIEKHEILSVINFLISTKSMNLNINNIEIHGIPLTSSDQPNSIRQILGTYQ